MSIRFSSKGDKTSDGTEITFIANYDINRSGDVAVIVNTGLTSPNVFLVTADGYYTVSSGLFPPEEGNYLLSIYSVDLRDDRRVYFTAQDYSGRLAVYAAAPLF